MKGESAVHLERAEELVNASHIMLSNNFYSDSISTGVRLFNRRIKSDYWAKPNDTVEDAQISLSFATEFVAACKTFLEGGG